MSAISLPRRERPLSAQVCLAVVLAAGFNVVWDIGLAWTVTMISAWMQPEEPFVQILITADGTPVRVRQPGDGRAREYTTLDGKPYPANEVTPWLGGAGFSTETAQARWSLTKPVAPRLQGFTDGLPSPVDWFFVQFDKSRPAGYLVGFDRVSRRRVGFLGRGGFQIAEPTADQALVLNRILDVSWGLIAPPGLTGGNTPAEYSYQTFSTEPSPARIPGAQLYLVGEDRIFRVDLRARTVEPVLEARGLRQIAVISRLRANAPQAAGKLSLNDALAARGPGAVIVLDALGRQETVYQLPAALSAGAFTFYQLADRTALALAGRQDRKNHMSYQDLIWFTKEGTIIRRRDGVLAGPDLRLSMESLSLIVAGAFPAPVGPIGAAVAYMLSGEYETSARTLREAVFAEIRSIVPGLFVATGLMAFALWLYFRRTARYGERRRAAWLVLIAFWGLPAYIGYVLVRHWPARIACESCGERAPRDRDACFDCGEEFPLPAQNGLEIYA